MSKCVAEICAERELTIPALVQCTGLEPNRVMAIVSGRWTPSPVEREKIAAALAVSAVDIAWGHKTPVQHIYGHGPA